VSEVKELGESEPALTFWFESELLFYLLIVAKRRSPPDVLLAAIN